ncbi:aminotransferase class I/II-fold pyridoxal phosphate-dependent enzyme [Spirochaetes bacterium]|uniref:Aminotransferase n=1 Tax=Candidatus Scatousia excrementipullorum TaxID=2840936 RepID=A0A9D9DQR5_9BACT|nr:aminotransferase class I/II-fold pyridoxal phosphate-dependent enzyme [Candidatus Scatousia excrementipullorum]
MITKEKFINKLFNKDVMSLDTYIMFRLKEKTEQLKPELIAKNRAPISLSMGAPTANPPKQLIDKLKAILDEGNGIHAYSVPKGEPYFRKACAERMKNRFGVELNPDTEIFSLIGSKEGIANLIRFMITPKEELKEKDIIMVPDPCYASYLQFIQCSGGYAFPVPLTEENHYMPDMEQVWQNLLNQGFNPDKVKALMINYPNNPLGASATREYVQKVIDFCKKHEILLISDAAYCDLYFADDEKPFSIFELEGAKDIGIEFYSLSKPYAITGWRLGWVCGNSDVIQRFGKGKSTIDNGIFKALQKACAEYINTEDAEKYIEKGNLDYKRKQAIMVKGFKELGWPIDEKTVPHTTFYLWLPIPKRYSSAFDFCADVLEKSGVVLVPGNAFGNHGEGYFRLSYVASDEQLQEVIDRFKADGFYFNK